MLPMSDCTCSSTKLFNFGCQCKNIKPLKVWHNGVDWVIARDIEEARDIVKTWCGYEDGDECIDGDEGWTTWPDDKELSICEDLANPATKTILTAKEWVAECGEPQFLASREY